MKKLRSLTLALMAAAALATAHGQALRPEIGKPLQQASDYLRQNKAREALGKVREAEAVANRTPAEQLMIDRMKAAAAQRAGDNATAVQALEALAARASGAELGQIAEQLAAAYAQMRNNAKANEWVQRAVAAGNNSATLKQLQSFLQAASGDYAAIARDVAASIAAAEQAGRKPEEADLLRLADAQQRLGQTGPYIATLEKLLLSYPGKRDYWSAYLARLPRKSGFAPRFEIDMLRLRLASGTLTRTEDFMEYAQLALQAALPAEAVRVVERGFAAGALGTGPEAARHQRLRDLAAKRLEEQKAGIAALATEAAAQPDGEALVRIGYTFVTLGEAERGITLIEQGIAKGKLRQPEDARLRLGMAQLQVPARRAAGQQTLRAVKGTDGVADIARLWTIVPAAGG
jgi:hypothetical protein